MLEIRFGRGWSHAELAAHLARLPSVPLNYDARPCDMTSANGWNRWLSTAPIAREAPGEPVPNGAFERAKRLVTSYLFSDPRIITAHFNPDVPLLGRNMLLEIKVLGLRYLVGTRVDDVRDGGGPERTTWGYRYSTLAGHIERGAEWFVLEKEHATGEVRFSIHARWRSGDFPNWWTEVGFDLLALRYQRAWHRLAYLRLRQFLGAKGLPEVPQGAGLLHAEVELPAPRLRSMAASTAPPSFPRESQEVVHKRPADVGAHVLTALRLGAVSGMRSMLLPALLSRTVGTSRAAMTNPLARVLGSRPARRVLPLFAAAELVADKLPFTPDRTDPPAVLGRVLSGAASAAATGVDHDALPRLSVAGGLGALASTFAFHRLRVAATRSLGVPNGAAGLVEDALAITLARRFAAARQP